jgi:glycosyltransferase involved in cell wall biosynthesis
MLKVLVVGQTPPPYHGQGIMIERLIRTKMPGVQLIHARMGFSSDVKDVGRLRIAKVFRMFSLIVRIIYHRFADGARILYYPPGGPDRVPMIRDIIILLSTRWLFDRTIFHHHTGGTSQLYDSLPAWQKWLFRRAYFGADASIRNSALNPEDGKLLASKREYIIPNAIEDPCSELSDSPAETATPPEVPLRILFAGSLRRSKGLMVLIEACGTLKARGVEFGLEVMGTWQNSDFAAEVAQRINELGLSADVKFLGLQTGNNKFAAFCRANVFCFPTFFKCETFGLVILEAMACRRPVVATRWRGIPSVVDDGETGFLVEPQDPGAVADRLIQLAEDPELRQRMGLAGRRKFEREFTFPRHASRMRRMFLETAGVEVDEQCEWASAATAVP